MRNTLMKSGVYMALACLPILGWGQTVKDTLYVNLEQALKIALSDNPTIKIAEQEIKRVDYSKQSAWIGLLPTLDGTAQVAKYLIPAKMSMMGMIIDQPTDYTAAIGATLSLPLIAPALWKSIQMTTLDMQLATEKAQASKINMRNAVNKAYYNILLAQESYQALLNGYQLLKDNYDLAKQRFEVGVAAEYDVVTAETQMQNQKPMLLQVENGIVLAKTFLKVLMGVDVATPLKVEGSFTDYEVGITATDGNRDISLHNNSDLRQLEIQQQQLHKSLQMVRSQRFPILAAFANYNYVGTGNKETTLNFGGMPIQVDKSSQWFGQGLMIGLQLNIPLTGLLTNIPREKQIQVQEKQLDLTRNYLADNLSLQVRMELDNMDRAVKQMDAAKQGVTLAEKGYKIANSRYESGAGIILEVQNALQQLTQASLAYMQAIADYLTAKANYEQLIGK
ncbi:MAG: TolC family protein [Bacteroidales bacterium]|nr:TolC family protein [Bacteroidales bacterium]MCL2132762.1 TolC family protein [Bacteroidales bacterium]